MKLKEFIKELENISKHVKNQEKIEVRMADYIPVVRPVLEIEDNTVVITDIGPK